MTELPPIRPLMQPDDLSCGPTCVAMIAGVTVDEAVRACKWGGPTAWNDLARALRVFRIRCGESQPFKSEAKWNREQRSHALPDFAIMELRDRPMRKWGHVIVLRDTVVYDPTFGCAIPYLGYRRGVLDAQQLQFSFYLPILGRA